ncbi:uncharacterized protein [Misgurnus anguillicaudatus]|uniref:uncharacterized protein n=1 Tax=Misgurnus anguillicaudatus TaxID=75329 RepID=UPI003CCF5C86
MVAAILLTGIDRAGITGTGVGITGRTWCGVLGIASGLLSATPTVKGEPHNNRLVHEPVVSGSEVTSPKELVHEPVVSGSEVTSPKELVHEPVVSGSEVTSPKELVHEPVVSESEVTSPKEVIMVRSQQEARRPGSGNDEPLKRRKPCLKYPSEGPNTCHKCLSKQWCVSGRGKRTLKKPWTKAEVSGKWTAFYVALLTDLWPSKALYNLPHIHPFTDSFIHRRRCQPCQLIGSSWG